MFDNLKKHDIMKPLTTEKWRSIKEFCLLESWNDGSRQIRAFRITPWSWISER